MSVRMEKSLPASNLGQKSAILADGVSECPLIRFSFVLVFLKGTTFSLGGVILTLHG